MNKCNGWMPVRVILWILERLYNYSDFQMIDEAILRHAKLLREELCQQWEVMSKYESAVMLQRVFSRAG